MAKEKSKKRVKKCKPDARRREKKTWYIRIYIPCKIKMLFMKRHINRGTIEVQSGVKNNDKIYPVSSSTSLIVFVASVPEVEGAVGPPAGSAPAVLFDRDADGGEDGFPPGPLPPCSPMLGVLLSGSSSFIHAFSSMFVHFPLVPAWLCFRCWRKWSAR